MPVVRGCRSDYCCTKSSPCSSCSRCRRRMRRGMTTASMSIAGISAVKRTALPTSTGRVGPPDQAITHPTTARSASASQYQGLPVSRRRTSEVLDTARIWPLPQRSTPAPVRTRKCRCALVATPHSLWIVGRIGGVPTAPSILPDRPSDADDDGEGPEHEEDQLAAIHGARLFMCRRRQQTHSDPWRSRPACWSGPCRNEKNCTGPRFCRADGVPPTSASIARVAGVQQCPCSPARANGDPGSRCPSSGDLAPEPLARQFPVKHPRRHRALSSSRAL
jgi:hypothetical protein